MTLTLHPQEFDVLERRWTQLQSYLDLRSAQRHGGDPGEELGGQGG